jgi:hypothetical protein
MGKLILRCNLIASVTLLINSQQLIHDLVIALVKNLQKQLTRVIYKGNLQPEQWKFTD